MKGTRSSDDYRHMLSYFVQYQSITDKSDNTSIASTVGIPNGVGRVSNTHPGRSRFGRLSSQSQNRQRFNGNIPRKQNSGNQYKVCYYHYFVYTEYFR